MEYSNYKNINILIVDNEETLLAELYDTLKKEGYHVVSAGSTDSALVLLYADKFDVLITELDMPEKSGFDLIEDVQKNCPELVVLAISEDLSVDDAIRAIKLEVYDFIKKPIDHESFRMAVHRAAEKVALVKENKKNIHEMEKLNHLKNEFISVVSHDLRSPLMTISGYVNFLIKQNRLNEQQNRYLRVIREIADNTYFLVNELLDVSKIERGIIEICREEFDLVELVNSSVNNFLLLAVDKKIKIDLYDRMNDPIVFLDKIKINQVLNNLINNAIKFTENGTITVTVSENGPDSIEICVSDTGVGMTPDELTLIFNKYKYYYKEGTRGEKGNGLGIVICKSFVELHGGTITASSEPGKGSSFCVALPRK